MAELKATKVTLNDGSPCVIRSAYDHDAAELNAYLNAVGGESPYLEFGADDYYISEAEELNVIRLLFAAENSILLVAVVAEEIVGTLTARGGRAPRMRHHAWLGVNVARGYWGMGVGRLLMKIALRWAESNPTLRKIHLLVRHDNGRAIDLYEKFGFIQEGRLTRMLHADGQFHDSLCMGREV